MTSPHPLNTDSNANAQPSSVTHNRIVLLVFVLLFSIPALAAFWLHKTGAWESSIHTAHGELINPLASFYLPAENRLNLASDQPDPSNVKRWKMIFEIPSVCGDGCLATLYQMKQVHEATGANQNRVQRWLLLSPHSDPAAAKLAASLDNSFIIVVTEDDPIASLKTSPHFADYWYLADPLDNIMIRFPTPDNQDQAIREGEGALKDIQRLLKVSKIG